MSLKKLKKYFLPGPLKHKTLLVFTIAENCVHMVCLRREKSGWKEVRRKKMDMATPLGSEISLALEEFAVLCAPYEAVVVMLAAGLFQLKTFPFPPLSKAKTQKAISFELEEYFPQLGAGAIFDFETTKKNKQGQEIRVAAVASRVVEDILALLFQVGIEPQFIKPVLEEVDFSATDYLAALLRNLDSPLLLFPRQNRLFSLLSLERTVVASWAMALVIFLLMFSFIELRGLVLERRSVALQKTLEKLKPEAAETIKLKEGVVYLKEKEEAVFKAASSLEKHDAVLKNVAYAIPEGVWIKNLRSDIYSGEVVIEGLSEASGGINDFMFNLREYFLIVNLKLVKEEMQGAQMMQEFKIVLQGESSQS